MPKYGIHHIVLKNVRDKLAQNTNTNAQGTQAQRIAMILTTQPFAASLGAIGPDLLFWAPDYDIVKCLEGLIRIKAEIDEKIQNIERITDALEECVDETVDRAINRLSLIPGLGPIIADVRTWDQLLDKLGSNYENLADALDAELEQALFAKVLGLDGTGTNNGFARNLFQTLFHSKSQEGLEEMDWYWFEMLHYRRTGDFARKLITLAEAGASDMQKAYAYGYATHYATDFVGHPYVNTVSGAPYRISVQRHVVIENYMDQWKWGREFPGESIRNTLVENMSQTRFDLPDQIADMIATALKETYEDEVHPMRYFGKTGEKPTLDNLFNADQELNTTKVGFLTGEDIKLAYKAQRLMLDHLGNREEVIKPAEPFPGADAVIASIKSEVNNFSLPSVNVNLPQADDFLNWDSIFQSIQDTVKFILDSIGTIASTLRDIITNPDAAGAIAEFVAKMAVSIVNYWIQLEMYRVYRMINQVLALSGLSYPEPDEADLSNPVARRLITLEGAERDRNSAYPLMRNPGQPHLDRRAYIDCTSASCGGTLLNINDIDTENTDVTESDLAFLRNNRAEQPVTKPSFYPLSATTTPDIFISGTPFDQAALLAYAACTTPEAVDTVYANVNHRQVGNAIDLSVFIIENALTTNVTLRNTIFCNWNLDGDRGYGHKCWDGVPPTVFRGEIKLAAESNSERMSELIAQNFKCWTGVDQDLGSPFRSHYVGPRYVNRKAFKALYVSPLTIAQDAIPPEFFCFSKFPDPKTWTALLPEYLKIVPGGRQKNVYFVNGMATSRSSGMRSTKGLQHVLNTALSESNITGYDKTANVIHIRNLINYTHHPTFNCTIGLDVWESFANGHCYSDDLDFALDNNMVPPAPFLDPSIVAILALLHHAHAENEEIMICGHSQGSILIGIAVLLFNKISVRHNAYLSSKVKVMLFEPELIIPFRKKLRACLEGFLVYIMNESDPNGTDVLTELAGGEATGIRPNQTQILDEPEFKKLAELLADPHLFDATYYPKVMSKVAEMVAAGGPISQYFTRWVSIYQEAVPSFNLFPHNMPSQLIVINKDIRDNRFRTDSGVLPPASRNQQMSTPNAPDSSSISVRDFFMK